MPSQCFITLVRSCHVLSMSQLKARTIYFHSISHHSPIDPSCKSHLLHRCSDVNSAQISHQLSSSLSSSFLHTDAQKRCQLITQKVSPYLHELCNGHTIVQTKVLERFERSFDDVFPAESTRIVFVCPTGTKEDLGGDYDVPSVLFPKVDQPLVLMNLIEQLTHPSSAIHRPISLSDYGKDFSVTIFRVVTHTSPSA